MEQGFEECKKKHEEKWPLDETLKFKAVARRNKLLGLWAGAEMGMTPEEAGAYAKTVVAAAIQPGGVLAKVTADIALNGLAHGEDAIHRKMEELLLLAEDQVKAGI
jgi:hypothetical protein